MTVLVQTNEGTTTHPAADGWMRDEVGALIVLRGDNEVAVHAAGRWSHVIREVRDEEHAPRQQPERSIGDIPLGDVAHIAAATFGPSDRVIVDLYVHMEERLPDGTTRIRIARNNWKK